MMFKHHHRLVKNHSEAAFSQLASSGFCVVFGEKDAGQTTTPRCTSEDTCRDESDDRKVAQIFFSLLLRWAEGLQGKNSLIIVLSWT